MAASFSASQSNGIVTLKCTGTSKVNYARTFEFEVIGVDYSDVTVKANVQPGTVKTTINLPTYGTYTCRLRVYNSSTGSVVYSPADKTVTWSAPAPTTTTVEVQIWVDGSQTTYGTCSKTVGSSYTVSNLMSSAGVSAPSGKTFRFAEDMYAEYQSTSSSVTIRSNHVLQVFYETPQQTTTSVTFKTYLDGTQYDTKTANFSPQSHTYQQWYDSFINNYSLIVPSGNFSAIKDGSTTVSLDDILSVSGNPSSVTVNVYYETPPASNAYIYDGTQWVNAVPYIYNGSSWVVCTPYIYDGGWQS